MKSLVPLLLFFCLSLSPSPRGWMQDTKPTADTSDLAVADRLYQSGKFAEAADGYQAVLKADPSSVQAQSGLIRSLLKEEKIDDAMTLAKSATAAQPNSDVLSAAMGDVQFRFGQMSPAELSYQKALKLDPKNVESYLGLARIYRAYSLYAHAYENLERAHQIAPNNPQVQRMWFGQLSRKDRIATIEAYLAAPHPDDLEQTGSLQRQLTFLKATQGQSHACRLVSKVEETDTKLEVLRRDPQHIFGVGLVVNLNGHDARLVLDTGAGGISISRKTAEKAGLTLVTEERFYGIGDKGAQAAYSAIAGDIRIGALEFKDCVVHVSNSVSMTAEDGLIGADVFSSYLIDIDIPEQKLRLSPLPKRPDETTAPTALKTSEQSDPSDDEEGGDSSEKKKDDSGEGAAKLQKRLPQDRYVAPEMAKWTPLFRFGSHLLIPTRVNDSPPMLFLIDTGATINMLSTRAARQVTKVSSDPHATIKGLNGTVSKVYSADKATLVFGHYAQKNQDVVTFDLSNISSRMGTEVSGTLGFAMLHMLQIKIDYRDGLVDFFYDPKRWDH